MDCKTAIEYINAYADNMLNKKETEQLLSHISSCSGCKKVFEDILAVKKALAGLSEIEPPAGLALSAIKKAQKRRIPVFAYASAGIAAAIALVAVFSSGIFNNAEYYGMNKAAPAASSAPMALESDMELAYASSEMNEVYATEAPMYTSPSPAATMMPTSEDGISIETRKASVPYITVPADVSENFRQDLEIFLDKNSIGYSSYETSSSDTVSFKITEDKLEDLKLLIAKYLQYLEELKAGIIEFIFNKY